LSASTAEQNAKEVWRDAGVRRVTSANSVGTRITLMGFEFFLDFLFYGVKVESRR